MVFEGEDGLDGLEFEKLLKQPRVLGDFSKKLPFPGLL